MALGQTLLYYGDSSWLQGHLDRVTHFHSCHRFYGSETHHDQKVAEATKRSCPHSRQEEKTGSRYPFAPSLNHITSFVYPLDSTYRAIIPQNSSSTGWKAYVKYLPTAWVAISHWSLQLLLFVGGNDYVERYSVGKSLVLALLFR